MDVPMFVEVRAGDKRTAKAGRRRTLRDIAVTHKFPSGHDNDAIGNLLEVFRQNTFLVPGSSPPIPPSRILPSTARQVGLRRLPIAARPHEFDLDDSLVSASSQLGTDPAGWRRKGLEGACSYS
ncbi:hypothetical protein [Candidatus Palauibacter sp.]|uniref:hypothetical protein n=1 Tax=Candidatus Palauibacter sp. TaxID=3101350 RepID=UPI003D14FD53